MKYRNNEKINILIKRVWLNHRAFLKETLDEMAEIAPMLAHFGYDPEGNARMAIIAFILTYYHCHMDGISLMRNNIK